MVTRTRSIEERVFSTATLRTMPRFNPVSPASFEPLRVIKIEAEPLRVFDAHRQIERGLKVVAGIELFLSHSIDRRLCICLPIDDPLHDPGGRL